MLPRITKGVEALTKDSTRDPLTNCTIRGPGSEYVEWPYVECYKKGKQLMTILLPGSFTLQLICIKLSSRETIRERIGKYHRHCLHFCLGMHNTVKNRGDGNNRYAYQNAQTERCVPKRTVKNMHSKTQNMS